MSYTQILRATRKHVFYVSSSSLLGFTHAVWPNVFTIHVIICLQFFWVPLSRHDLFLWSFIYLRTNVLQCLVSYNGLCSVFSTCSVGILILTQKNLSKQRLLRFLCLSIKFLFTAYAVKSFNDCSTKLDHAELLSLSKLNI